MARKGQGGPLRVSGRKMGAGRGGKAPSTPKLARSKVKGHSQMADTAAAGPHTPKRHVVRVKKADLVAVPVDPEGAHAARDQPGSSLPPQSSVAELIRKFRSTPPQPREKRDPVDQSSFWWLRNGSNEKVASRGGGGIGRIPASQIPRIAGPSAPHLSTTPSFDRYGHTQSQLNEVHDHDQGSRSVNGNAIAMPNGVGASMDFLSMPWVSPRRSVELQHKMKEMMREQERKQRLNGANSRFEHDFDRSHDGNVSGDSFDFDVDVDGGDVDTDAQNRNARMGMGMGMGVDVRSSVDVIAALEDRAMELLHQAAVIKSKSGEVDVRDTDSDVSFRGHGRDHGSMTTGRAVSAIVDNSEMAAEAVPEYEAVLDRARRRLGFGGLASNASVSNPSQPRPRPRTSHPQPHSRSHFVQGSADGHIDSDTFTGSDAHTDADVDVDADVADMILKRARERLSMKRAMKKQRGDEPAADVSIGVGDEVEVEVEVAMKSRPQSHDQLQRKSAPERERGAFSPVLEDSRDDVVRTPTPLELDGADKAEADVEVQQQLQPPVVTVSTPNHSPMPHRPPTSPIHHSPILAPTEAEVEDGADTDTESESGRGHRRGNGKGSVASDVLRPLSPTPPTSPQTTEDERVRVRAGILSEVHPYSPIETPPAFGNDDGDEDEVSPPGLLNLSATAAGDAGDRDGDCDDGVLAAVDEEPLEPVSIPRSAVGDTRKPKISFSADAMAKAEAVRVTGGKEEEEEKKKRMPGASKVKAQAQSESQAKGRPKLRDQMSDKDDGEVRHLVHSVVSAWLFSDDGSDVVMDPITLNTTVSPSKSASDRDSDRDQDRDRDRDRDQNRSSTGEAEGSEGSEFEDGVTDAESQARVQARVQAQAQAQAHAQVRPPPSPQSHTTKPTTPTSSPESHDYSSSSGNDTDNEVMGTGVVEREAEAEADAVSDADADGHHDHHEEESPLLLDESFDSQRSQTRTHGPVDGERDVGAETETDGSTPSSSECGDDPVMQALFDRFRMLQAALAQIDDKGE